MESVLLWYHRFWQSSSREGGLQNFAQLVLNALSKFAQNFTVGLIKLLSHQIHIASWGNFSFIPRVWHNNFIEQYWSKL